MHKGYSDEVKQDMRMLYQSLSEKDRRRYGAVEAKKLGHGGIVYIASLFDCDEKTIRKGISELNDHDCMGQERIRREGGGRQSKLEKYDNIDRIFLEVLREHTAGDPMDEKVKWTNLTRSDIAKHMLVKGLQVSKNIIRKLLKKHGYVKRKALKKSSSKQHKNRDCQFNKISVLRKEYEDSDNPILSIDAKKKNSLEICTERVN